MERYWWSEELGVDVKTEAVGGAEDYSNVDPIICWRQELSELITLICQLDDILGKVDVKLRENIEFEVVVIFIFDPELKSKILWNAQVCG